MELLVPFVLQNIFPHCDGSIVIFDGCWLKNIVLQKLARVLRSLILEEYGAPSIHILCHVCVWLL